jgi:CelD/BcsL family acetyltransferase involved in cellulose biosynthesis
LHALSVGGRIVAAYAGVVRGARFSAMINSFDMDEEIARSSPGDLLLHALMRNLVGRGMTAFDLGAGEARYKNAVCDETIELCDVIAPISAQGALAAPLFSAFLRLKRRVKQTPALSRAYYRLRGLIRAKG